MSINYTNRNLRPKTFYARIIRNRSGDFILERVRVLKKKNQYRSKVKPTDARDFVNALTRSGLYVA